MFVGSRAPLGALIFPFISGPIDFARVGSDSEESIVSGPRGER